VSRFYRGLGLEPNDVLPGNGVCVSEDGLGLRKGG